MKISEQTDGAVTPNDFAFASHGFVGGSGVMSPDHPTLATPPQKASDEHGERFLTTRQALWIEEVLGVPARDLLIEAAIHEIDEKLAKARGEA